MPSLHKATKCSLKGEKNIFKKKPLGPFIRPEYGALFFFDERQFTNAIKRGNNHPDIFRHALKHSDSHLKTRFKEGESIHRLVFDRSALIDRLIYYAWRQFDWGEDIALFAVGGYGRGEMHPHSDIDLLFLLDKNNAQKYKASIEHFLTFLWDMQLNIGHSVRTAKECLNTAKDDATIMTSLLERRLLVGSVHHAKKLDKTMDKAWQPLAFFQAKNSEQQQRHNRHGITEFDLEPNVKESPGGLRDIQTIHWVAKHVFNVSGFDQLAAKEFYTEEEYNTLLSAESFLWKVRFGLHTLNKRPNEKLDFESQRQLAQTLGFTDTAERLGVERFMQRYYQTASAVREITDVLMQLLHEQVNHKKEQPCVAINKCFYLSGTFLKTTADDTYIKKPKALLETFVLLSQDKSITGLHADSIRKLRQSCHLIDDDFRQKKSHRRLFMELLKSPNHLMHPLQLMRRYGVLGRYLPEFSQVTGLTQHDLFHIYPVDIHTLAVVRNLREFGLPSMRKKFPISNFAFSSYPKPELLVVAALYHDIGKGRGGDHSELGAIEVARFAALHGFSETEIKLLVWLVKNHLLMSQMAQREDASDPDVIERFAKHVGDEMHLNLLYALTTADILATNPALWNNWRASLLRQLYHNTYDRLKLGNENPLDSLEVVVETKKKAKKILLAKNILHKQYAHYWQQLNNKYFHKEVSKDIAWHTEQLLLSENNPAPVVAIKPFVFYDRDRATVIFAKSSRSNRLFCDAATAVGNAGLSIQDARIYSMDNTRFLTMFVLDENGNAFNEDKTRISRLKKMLQIQLDARQPSKSIKHLRTTRQLKQFPIKTLTRMLFANNQSILEVTTADRAGLLANIAEILLAHELTITNVTITTLGERVEDLFVLVDKNGYSLADSACTDHWQNEIRETIDQRVDEDQVKKASSFNSTTL